MAGRHGSLLAPLLQMFTAHCQTSMQSRVTTARNILEDYEMEERTGHLVDTDRVHPDLGILRLAISQGKYAVQNNQSGANSSAPIRRARRIPDPSVFSTAPRRSLPAGRRLVSRPRFFRAIRKEEPSGVLCFIRELLRI